MGSMEIIERAKDILRRKPVDTAHGLDHHEAVVDNCLRIIQAERLSIDIDSLKIAAWWHDLESQQGATDVLRKEMVLLGFDQQSVETVSAIVRSHTYGGKQKTVEAKVLFDADKIEYFNPKRIRDALEDAQKGVLPISALEKYYHSWFERHQRVLDSFHFGYSKKVAQDNLAATSNQIEKTRIFLESVKLRLT